MTTFEWASEYPVVRKSEPCHDHYVHTQSFNGRRTTWTMTIANTDLRYRCWTSGDGRIVLQVEAETQSHAEAVLLNSTTFNEWWNRQAARLAPVL